MSKRLDRMSKWIEENPYEVYGDNRDRISDKQAAMILSGDFDGFMDSWWEVEINCSDNADWSDWEKEFVREFYPNLDDVSFRDLPQAIQEHAMQERQVDCSDLLETSVSNWNGHVCARLKKRNGDYIEFPNWETDAGENKRYQDYLKRMCGIDGWKAEATYPGTYLTVLGYIDLWEVMQMRKVPTKVKVSKDCFTIGHEPCQGSGTCGIDQYQGKPRYMDALIFVDGSRGYGVDDIFGLTGKCWSNEIEVR